MTEGVSRLVVSVDEDLIAAHGRDAFRLLCVDVRTQEVLEAEQELLEQLATEEHRTHLDFNIACALHFASRGRPCRSCDGSFFTEQWWRDFSADADSLSPLSEQSRVSSRVEAASKPTEADQNDTVM